MLDKSTSKWKEHILIIELHTRMCACHTKLCNTMLPSYGHFLTSNTKTMGGGKKKKYDMVLVHIPQGVNVHHEPSTNKIKAQIKYSDTQEARFRPRVV